MCVSVCVCVSDCVGLCVNLLWLMWRGEVCV